nr:histone deacetylase 5 [Tanacetum cinerariifolium]
FESTWRVIKAVRVELSTYWPILADKLPENLTSRVAPLVLQTYSSESDDEYDDGSNAFPEDLQEDVTIPLS